MNTYAMIKILISSSYDPERDAWTSVASMGCARLGVGVAVVNRLLYAVGGFDGARRIASVECYHPENNCWNEIAPMNIARSGAGTIFIFFLILYQSSVFKVKITYRAVS